MFSARNTSKKIFATVAVGVLGLSSVAAKADGFFDWGQGAAPINPAYTPVINVTDSNASQAAAMLQAQKNAGQPLAVKVNAGVTLSPATINQIFNNASLGPVKYVFADYEGPNAANQIQTLVSQITPTTTGNGFAAGTSFIGNYALAPIPGSDPTAHFASSYPAGNSPTNPYLTATDFRNSGVNMATEALYPGDASFRNPVTNDSTAPNIRSALFTLPIQRLSISTQNLGQGQINIPFVSRFNNFANSTLSNSTFANPQGFTQNAFNTAGSSINGQSVSGQLLSRNDFQAMMLHYRMRGASGYQLLDPGVVGYSVSDYENDAQAGWSSSASTALINSVLSGPGGRVAQLPTVVTVNGSKQTLEQSGVVWSVVTNDATAGSPGLGILISNLSNGPDLVSFNTRINGAQLTSSATVGAGSHVILRFTKSGTLWAAFGGGPQPAFSDAALASRDGIGIPEPTTLSLLGLGAMGVLARRRRNV